MSNNIELRDEIAKLTGWTRHETGNIWKKDGLWRSYPDMDDPHPIPNTLDEAAKLPPEWTLQNIGFHIHGVAEPLVAAFATKGDWRLTMVDGVEVPKTRMLGEGRTELEARFALRLGILRSEKEQP